ncbi:MAG: hypothetical protein Q7I99_05820 [Acholeplasmataceae bacterium]|nr:hypothetical protein [Acholeplasmataceae bacterium]
MHYKRLSILIFGLIGLLIVSISIYIGFEYLVGLNKWLGLIIGVLFMMLGGIIYQYGEKFNLVYIFSFILNMIGVGLSITAYYILKAYALNFHDFYIAIVVSMAVLSGFGLLTFIPIVNRHLKISIAITIIIAFISSLVLWLSVDEFTGLSFYFLNVIYFFMVAMIGATNSLKDLNKEMAQVSFGSFILVSIIVLIILSEGEALNGLDGIGSGSTHKKARKK